MKSVSTLKTFKNNGARVDYEICDISNENNVIKTCQTLNERNEKIDVLVNSA
ncbi:hypothetical protein BLA29_014954, partial [Euroglyphus maynei]